MNARVKRAAKEMPPLQTHVAAAQFQPIVTWIIGAEKILRLF